MTACLGQRAAFLLASADRPTLSQLGQLDSNSWNFPLVSPCSRLAPSYDLAGLYADSFIHILLSLFQASMNFDQTLDGSLNN